MSSSTLKNLFLWMAILLVAILLWNTLNAGQSKPEEIPYSQFMTKVDKGEISDVTITDNQEVKGSFKGGQSFKTMLPFQADSEFIGRLQRAKVEIKGEISKQNPLFAILITWAPVLLLVGLWIFFMRQMQSGGNKALSFGKSKAKLLNASGKKVTFKDVAGVEEAKEELQEIVEFLKEPQKFQKLGGRIPKGVLLMGPPGTGKTLLARAIAGEANVPFFSISGSDFVEMFVGVGASRVRDLFEQGKKNAPCIIFIDEIDAVGRHRGAGLGGGHDEREQTLNQLLVEMDGFESNEGVILIAATNRPDVLDPALLRPGRFDRRVVVDRPDINGRLGILKVHVRNIPLSDDVELAVIARGTPGFSGADLANLVNEAALIAARRNKKKVGMEDFEFAKDKVLMGVERKTLMLTDEEKRVTAYHEAGHALVAAFTPGADPLHKVTIIPRGRALGLTMQLPTEDKYTYKKRYVEAQISILMGGRVAEELTQEDITTGAGNDIERATEMARRMVCEWGMSELGPLAYAGKDEPVFLGRDIAQRADYSEHTAHPHRPRGGEDRPGGLRAGTGDPHPAPRGPRAAVEDPARDRVGRRQAGLRPDPRDDRRGPHPRAAGAAQRGPRHHPGGSGARHLRGLRGGGRRSRRGWRWRRRRGCGRRARRRGGGRRRRGRARGRRPALLHRGHRNRGAPRLKPPAIDALAIDSPRPPARTMSIATAHPPTRHWELPLPGGRTLALGPHPRVMGVLNLTPDSFSDGGAWSDPGRAVERALEMVAAGAAVVDLGAESTRPGGGVYGAGAAAVSAAEEWGRLEPVLTALRPQTAAVVSVDTRKGAVARPRPRRRRRPGQRRHRPRRPRPRRRRGRRGLPGGADAQPRRDRHHAARGGLRRRGGRGARRAGGRARAGRRRRHRPRAHPARPRPRLRQDRGPQPRAPGAPRGARRARPPPGRRRQPQELHRAAHRSAAGRAAGGEPGRRRLGRPERGGPGARPRRRPDRAAARRVAGDRGGAAVNPADILELLTWRDVLDVAAVTVVMYYLLRLVRGTRAVQMLLGLAFIAAIYYVARLLDLPTLERILESLLILLPIAAIVLFQQEIRRALAHFGRNPLWGFGKQQKVESTFNEIVLAATKLASQRVGALILVERLEGLRNYIENGIAVDAVVSYDLLINIFTPDTPLHDGAVIIQEDRIAAAACFLPLTFNPELTTEFGTRHRAALGITEETDALAVVVSEETGIISVARDGELIRDLDGKSLRNTLYEYLITDLYPRGPYAGSAGRQAA